MNILDGNNKPLKKFDLVRVIGDIHAKQWKVASIDGVDLNLQDNDGNTLTRMAFNVLKLIA